MKMKLKQSIKSIMAFGMALMMTLMPIGNVLPEVSVYAATGIMIIQYNKYITGIELYNSEGNPITADTVDTSNYSNKYTSISSGGYGYTLKATTTNSNLKAQISINGTPTDITETGYNLLVDEAKLANGESEVDYVISAVTDAEKTFEVSIDGATVTSVKIDDSTLVYDEANAVYKIPAGTDATKEVKVYFTLPMSKIGNLTDTKLQYDGVDTTNNVRKFIYTIEVGELLNATDPEINPTVNEAAKYKISMDANTTHNISSAWLTTEGGTTYYYAPYGDDAISAEISSNTGYRLKTLKVNSTVPQDFTTSSVSTFNVTINNGNAGKIEAQSEVVPIPTPVGTFDGVNQIYGKNSTINVIYEPTNHVTGYQLQWGVTKNTSETPVTWNTCDINDGKFSFSVPPSAAGDFSEYYIAYRYKSSVTESAIVYQQLQVDVTAPNVTSFSIEGNTEVNGEIWGNANNSISFKIVANDNGGAYKIGLSRVEYKVIKADGSTVAKSGTINYDENNPAFIIPYTKTDVGARITYDVYDNAGNKTSGSQDISNIKFDLTAPTVPTVKFYKEDGITEITDISKWLTENVKVVITPADTAPEAPTNEVMSGLPDNPDNNAVVVKDENNNPITVYKDGSNYYFTLSDNKEHKFTISVYDKAGNVTTTSEIVVKIDKAGLTISEFTVGGSTTGNAFSNAVESKVTVTSVSGLNRVDFVFHDNETGTEKTVTGTINQNVATCSFPINEFQDGFDGYVQAVCYDNAFDSLGDPSDINHKKSIQMNKVQYSKDGAGVELLASQLWTNQIVPVAVHVTSPKTDIVKVIYYVDGVEIGSETSFSNVHDVNTTLKIDKGSASPEGTEVVVKAITNSGLETSNSIRVYIDKQSPTVTLGGVTEGATYNSARSLQITTNDNIWQKLQPVSVTATKTIDGNTTNIDLGSYTVDSANHVMSKAFSEDGIYNVTVKAVDAAGNTDTKTISFTIDRTAPVISMTGVKEGAYSSNPVTVTFQSVESFFDTNNVKITVERKIEGSTYERTLTFNNTGKTSNLANTFTEDGDYTITMTAVDRAGNEATPQTLSFTVDCTAPSVTLTGTKDYFVTNQPVTLDFLVKEAYFETNQVQIRGSRRLANGKTEAINISGWSNTGISSSLSNEFMEDGYYTITISATDKAGNNKQQTIHFTIDTEAPVIGDLSQYDGKYLSSFELKESLEDLISELSVPTVKMTLNGEAYDGHEITEDGKYTLVIEVVDEVGLSSTKSVEFVIDKTAPKIIFAGVEDKKTYTEAVRLNLSLENENDTIVEILINGEPYELTEGQSSYDISFDTFGDYEVVVLTIDEAGNDNSQTIQFTYAEHKNMAFLWIVIGAVVVAAGLVIFLVVKSKKKQ